MGVTRHGAWKRAARGWVGACALVGLAIVAASTPAAALDLKATGTWPLPIDARNLRTGAGSDLQDSYESRSDLVRLQITGGGAKKTWRVDLHRTDTNWQRDLALWARRSSPADGNASASGGETYQMVDNIDRTLFTGVGTNTQIYVQLKLSGVSLRVPPGIYATTIVYTVVETL